MRKFTKLMLTLALLVVGVGGAKAIKTPGTEFTSVSALSGKTFAVINKTDGKAICNKTGGHDYDLQYLPYADAFKADVNGYLFKIEQISDGEDPSADGKYLIRVVDANGSNYKVSGWAAPYLQTNISGSGVCFFFSLSDKRGMDAKNTAAWDIQYDDENGGFTLKNIYTDKYINDPTQEASSDTPKYFTFCELDELTTTVSINNVSITETLASNPEHFTEITQDQGATLDNFARTELVEGENYNTYTCTEGIQVAFKMYDIDVEGCDFILVNFAEQVAYGWELAFWSKSSQKTTQVGTVSEYKYIFANDAECAIQNNTLPQLTMLRLWSGSTPLVAKVEGIYKHTAIDYNRTYSFDQALDFTDTGLEAYVISAFNPATATLTLSRVYQVPANTGVYLVGKGGDYNIPVIDSADPIATNLLHASSGTVALEPTESSNTNLIFGGSGENRGFHPLSAAGVIGANKAYLQLPTADLPTSGARLSFVFEDEITAIKTLNEVKAIDNAWYTVNGVKLNAKPTQKGIYINNGKKYAVK